VSDAGRGFTRIPFSSLTIVRELGSGAYGRVLLATLNHAEVVLKELFNSSPEVWQPAAVTGNDCSDHLSQYQRAFEAEMATVVAAAHPNVVRMLGVCRHEDRLFLVMERADGRCARVAPAARGLSRGAAVPKNCMPRALAHWAQNCACYGT
jgi:serine/threonine protein kinase